MAFDLTLDDGDDGKPWDFDDASKRAKATWIIRTQKPWLLIGSPMCGAFSVLQQINRSRMAQWRWQAMMEHGMKHVAFACELYAEQVKAGRLFLHQHPAYASSWSTEIVEGISKLPGVQTVIGDMCAYGMTSTDSNGDGPVLKPTKFMTNSDHIAQQLSHRCPGHPRHVQLINGRAAAAQVYPPELCKAILKGLP